jgi:hypothetical protein
LPLPNAKQIARSLDPSGKKNKTFHEQILKLKELEKHSKRLRGGPDPFKEV